MMESADSHCNHSHGDPRLSFEYRVDFPTPMIISLRFPSIAHLAQQVQRLKDICDDVSNAPADVDVVVWDVPAEAIGPIHDATLRSEHKLYSCPYDEQKVVISLARNKFRGRLSQGLSTCIGTLVHAAAPGWGWQRCDIGRLVRMPEVNSPALWPTIVVSARVGPPPSQLELKSRAKKWIAESNHVVRVALLVNFDIRRRCINISCLREQIQKPIPESGWYTRTVATKMITITRAPGPDLSFDVNGVLDLDLQDILEQPEIAPQGDITVTVEMLQEYAREVWQSFLTTTPIMSWFCGQVLYLA